MGSTEQPDPAASLRTDSPPDQRSVSILTTEGREALIDVWLSQRLSEGIIDPKKLYTIRERSELLGDWLRTLIAQGNLDSRKRLPPYVAFEELPFKLPRREVARVVAELRHEGLLPPRIPRIDKGRPQWTERDNYCMRWIGEMRAIRYDQLQRLLARLSKYETGDPDLLSMTRTSQIIRRWVRAQYVVYRHIYAKQPGWIYLTKTGLYHADLPYRAEPPRDRLLGHISAINEVRLKLERENPSLQWIGERAIQSAQKKRQRGQRLEHIPDGMIVSGSEHIDVEVQLSRPAETRVALVMRGSLGSSNMNPLRYYASVSAIAVIHKAYHEVMKGGWQGRPRIEIIELEQFLELSAGESAQ